MTEKDTGTDKSSDLPKRVLSRLQERHKLLATIMAAEKKHLTPGAAVELQAGAVRFDGPDKPVHKTTPDDVLRVVDYRLAISDIFVEKAQYHLEERASRYKILGYWMYACAIVLFVVGAVTASIRMWTHDNSDCKPRTVCVEQSAVAPVAPTANASPQARTDTNSGTDNTEHWIDLLRGFILAFTAYGFIVLTAVVLARGARACLDQRERLLTKRHSLRQGRLYLHLSGGRVTIEDLERAFNWNHEQYNAFTHMPTDAKAPWGNVIEEVVKIVPELVKAGVTAAKDTGEKKPAADGKGQGGN